MPGILRKGSGSPEAEHVDVAFDRKKVLENTKHNAMLGEEGERVRSRLKQAHVVDEEGDGSKKRFPKTKAPNALKKGELATDAGFTEPEGDKSGVEFDEDEIETWDKQRGQTEKISEPNTPYMGTAADTEYYDEDPVPDDLDLGAHA